jgi:hypothetical protein
MAAKAVAGNRVYAVITGDIVGSTKLGPDDMKVVRETLQSAFPSRTRNKLHKAISIFDIVHSHPGNRTLEFFRGDSWQVLVDEPRWALRLALIIQARLFAETAVSTRAAIGIGTVNRSSEKKASLMTGEAFTHSGRALEEITGYFRLTGALPTRFGTLASWFPVLLHLCSGLTSSWSQRQAQIVGLALTLPNPTHEAIAASLVPAITKQSVTNTLASANWRTLLEPIRMFEATDWQRLANGHEVETGDDPCLPQDRSKHLSPHKQR